MISPSLKQNDNINDGINEENLSESTSLVDTNGIDKLDIVKYEQDQLVQLNIFNIFINESIIFIIKKHDEGIGLDQIKQLIIQQTLQINQSTDELVEWLSNN